MARSCSSPIVWGNRLYLTGADRKTREVYCFNATDGRMLWRKGLPQDGLRVIIEAKDFTEMSAIMHVAAEGFVQSMFRMGEYIGQNDAEKRIFRASTVVSCANRSRGPPPATPNASSGRHSGRWKPTPHW